MQGQPPKLLFGAVGLQKGSGGIAELSRQVLKTLLDMHRKNMVRLEVHVLEGSGPQADDELFKDNELPVIRWFAGKRWSFALGLITAKSDVQLLDHVGLGRLPGLLPLSAGRKLILLIHSVEIWNNTRSDYHRTAKKASLLIANSEYTAKKARAHYKDLPEIRVCWPGKDPFPAGSGLAQEARHKTTPQISLGQHALLIVGRLSSEQRHKGHDHLMEAMPQILQAVPDAQLVIAGAGDDRARLEEKTRELDIADRVVFTGWVDQEQLQQLYSRCALFVMPSDGDGFGLVFLEAMMHSLPCVGLQSGAAAEIFEDEKSGILVNRDDRVAMADRLTRLLHDEALRKRLGEAGNLRYQAMFQGRHYSERLQSILVDHSGI
ncbi:glycosyltransferase family 4 protein [Pseudomonadota bacterium]